MTNEESEIAELSALTDSMTPEFADNYQQWAGMSGAVAFHLIDRHSDGWGDVSAMMDAWLRANIPNVVKCQSCGHEHEVPKV